MHPDPGALRPDEASAASREMFRLGLLVRVGAPLLQAMAELGLADLLAAGPRSPADLARAAGADADALGRVLRALALLGVVAEGAEGSFSLTPLGAALRSDAQAPLRDYVRYGCSPFLQRARGEALRSLRTGRPAFDAAYGAPFFDHLARSPADARLFDQAMASLSAAEAEAVAGAVDVRGLRRIVDVAGGTGTLLLRLLRDAPLAEGVLLDLPHVLARARPRVAAAGLAARCELVPGDMFEAVPRGGDLYLLKHILHDWDDARCARLLANVRAAAAPGARVWIVEAVLPPPGTDHPSALLDIEMLLITGGRERSAEEYAALLEGAGLRLARVVPTAAAVSVVEARVG